MASSTAPEQAPSVPETNGEATPATTAAAPTPAVPTPSVVSNAATAGAGSNAGVAQFHSASLYVGDLNPDVTEALLFDIFNAVGPVSSIRVCRDAVTRRSLGYAYVNFHQLSDAERALDTMNYTLIKDRPCRIMWSQRDPSLRRNGAGNVFVKNLDLSIDNKALYDTFSLFGNILSCKVVTDGSGKSKGYGFVHFETVEAASEAIRKINGMLIAGKEVFVGTFLKRNERPSATEWTNVYVKNIPKDWSTQKLEDIFGDCGPIASAVIKTDAEGKSKGFGFVDFAEHEGAVKAVEDMNKYEVVHPKKETEAKKTEEVPETTEAKPEETKETTEGEAKETTKEEANKETAEKSDEKKEAAESEAEEVADTTETKQYLIVCRFQKKNERERELSHKFEQLKVERMSKYQGVNLYVKNLPEEVDDDRLRKEFAAFGSITSSRVMRNVEKGPDGENVVGTSKGFGFICFTTPEEAIRAVTEMNGKLIGGKPVYVALAQRKEARRAQLEAQHQQRGALGGRGLPMQPGMYPGSPMFYTQGGMQPGGVPPQGRQNFAYMPQQMMARGMMQQQPRGMPAAYGRGYPMPAQPGFPVPGQVPVQGNTRGSRRGGRPGRGGGGVPGMSQQDQMQQPNQANFKYTANARNQPQSMQQPSQPQAPQAPQAPGAVAPLTAAALASASESQQKNMIGEKLYPLVNSVEPNLAGKITGMLLEMDNPELLHLLESPESLRAKITEAMQVLRQHQQL